MQNSIITKLRNSTFLGKISEAELNDLIFERDQSGIAWGNHYLIKKPDIAPLQYGKTIYINSLNVENGKTIINNINLFPKTAGILEKYTHQKKERLARSYWHRLGPKEWISPHKDTDSESGQYFSKIKRFHIYPQLPKSFIAIIDSLLWNEETHRPLSMSVIDFDFSQTHCYCNHSDTEISFFVADFYV